MAREPGLRLVSSYDGVDVDRLVASVARGDAAAFERLYDELSSSVYGLARRVVRDPTRAEDVTQETFLRAYRYLARLEDRARFAPWLYQIARSLTRERRRRQDVERRALVERAERLRPDIPSGMTMPELALRFILAHPDVGTVIPGMRKRAHVDANLGVSDGRPLDAAVVDRLRSHRWDRTPQQARP